MTTEEKLDHFYEHSIESARQKAEALIQEHKEALEKLFLDHKTLKNREMETEVAAKTEQLRRELNKTISAEQLYRKRILSKKNMEIKENLFNEVSVKLDYYRKSPDYPDFLCRKVQDALDFAGGDGLVLYIDPDDTAFIPVIQQKTGASLTVSQESFGGGVRAVIPNRNILIDNSFSTLLNNAKESFTFDGGLQHE